MPTTPNLGLRYPAGAGAADVVTDITNLATDVDNVLGAARNEDVFGSVGTCSIVVSTTTSYADITGASKNFNKILGGAGSDLIIDQISVGAWSNATTTNMKIGVNVNGVDTDVSIFQFSFANDRETIVGVPVRLAGLAAGLYTVKLRALRSSGTGTITVDTLSTVSFHMQERPL